MVNTLQSKRGLNEEDRKKRAGTGNASYGRQEAWTPLSAPTPSILSPPLLLRKRYCVEKINNKVIIVKRE